MVCQDIPKLLQLLFIRKLPEQKQVRHLFEAEILALESLHQFDTVVSPVPQFSLAGCLHTVHHFEGVDPGYIGQPCYHAVPVLVTQSPLYLIFFKQFRIQLVGIPAQCCIIIQIDFTFLQ